MRYGRGAAATSDRTTRDPGQPGVRPRCCRGGLMSRGGTATSLSSPADVRSRSLSGWVSRSPAATDLPEQRRYC
ncbi:DUF6207 family protein [Streptomyces sp. NPDC059755]|uniref:DUF6207 family protein n=1 Tax=Streptomyces sp. NPDC059755 TaxID=3346934 RepID=UPI003653A27A